MKVHGKLMRSHLEELLSYHLIWVLVNNIPHKKSNYYHRLLLYLLLIYCLDL